MHKTLYYAYTQHAFASFLITQDEHGVCALLLGSDPNALLKDLQRRFQGYELTESFEKNLSAIHAVEDFFAGRRPLELTLSVQGTAFQQRVWQALQRIPLGSTCTYRNIAQRIGQPSASRAVAGTCANNPIALAIPCHRVIRQDGALSGYRWGVEYKQRLLDLEQHYAGRGA